MERVRSAGFAEKSNRHGLLCFKTIPKSLSANRSWFYRAFCAGGINPVDPYNPEDNRVGGGGLVCFFGTAYNLRDFPWFL